jgi:hypothetical protein
MFTCSPSEIAYELSAIIEMTVNEQATRIICSCAFCVLGTSVETSPTVPPEIPNSSKLVSIYEEMKADYLFSSR